MADVPLPDPFPMIAPLFIANSLNWMCLGLLIVQCYYFAQNFPNERREIQLLVWGLFFLELLQTATTTHQAFWYCVTNWNKPAALLGFPWSAMTVPTMAGIIAAVVQCFYAWRIWTLSWSRTTRAIAVVIVVLAMTQMTTAIVVASVFQAKADPLWLIKLHPEFSLWISSSFVADVLVACSMLWILFSAKKSVDTWSETGTLISRLVAITIGTGAAIAICGALTLALFVTTVGASFQYLPAAYIWGKLYSNSVMVSLNSRKLKTTPENSTEHDSYPMSVHVSRPVFQVGTVTTQDPDPMWTTDGQDEQSKGNITSVHGCDDGDMEAAIFPPSKRPPASNMDDDRYR